MLKALKEIESIKTIDAPVSSIKTPTVDPTTVGNGVFKEISQIKTIDGPTTKYYSPDFSEWERQESRTKANSLGALYSTPEYQADIIKRTKGTTSGGFKDFVSIDDKAMTDGVIVPFAKRASDWQKTVRRESDILAEQTEKSKTIKELENERAELQLFVKNLEAREDVSGRYPLTAEKKTSDSDLKNVYQKRISDIDTLIASEKNAQELLDEERSWSKYFAYQTLMSNPDFLDKSKYVSTANGDTRKASGAGRRKRSVYTSIGYDDPEYEQINGNPVAIDYNETNQSVVDSNKHYSEMTEDEVGIFNYLYATEGKDAAYEYVDFLENDISKTGSSTIYRRRRDSLEREAAEYAEKHPVLASAKTIVSAPLKAFTPVLQVADLIKNGEINQDADYNRLNFETNAIRQAVSEDMNGVGRFFYKTGMSIGDFATTLAVSVGNPTVSLAIMGSSVAGDTVIEARDRGLNSAQALSLGILSGAAEVVMEKIGLDALFGGSWSKNGIRYVLKNALAEGGEEAGTNLINTFADILVSGDKSHWQTAINNYKAQGMTESQAWLNAVKDKALEIGTDALSGVVSGTATSGTLSAPQIASDFNKAQSEWTGKNKYFDELEARAKTSGKSMAELYLEDYESGALKSTSVELDNNNTASVNKAVETMSKDGRSIITVKLSKDNYENGLRFKNFINSVNSMLDKSLISKRKHKIGEASKKHTEIVNSLMKTINPRFSSEGYQIWIDGTGASHTYIRHGENGKADKSMFDEASQFLIPWAIQNADSGEFILDKNGNVSLSTRFQNSDGSYAPQIRIEKKVGNNTIYVSECVPDSTNKIIWITSSYIKKGSKGQLLNIEEYSSPQPTSETSLDSNATDVSISQPDSSVNPDTSDTKDEDSQLPYTVQNDPLPFVTAEEYITEEYREKTASNRAFTDDPTKYEGKERYIVERAIASGVLNDTEASHRLVDLAAKLYSRTGVEFEFVDNARLKESGFSVGNRFVNGVYTGKTVLINAESRKAWQSVIGHEITHVLEGSKHYDSLQRAVIGYAKQIGTYDAKLQEITDTYSAVENANITEELCAELVGEYLFSDEGFVNSLAAKQPNVAQRILNEIKHVISLIKANTPEARKLLIAQHRLERALDSKINNSGEKNIKYSINADFYNKLSKWDKKTIGFSFVVGETSTALQQAGIPKKQIRWDASKIASLLNKHNGMSIKKVGQIANLLEDPIIVIDSKQNNASKIIMGDLYDDNGKVITAVLLLTPTSKKGNVLDLIKVSSAEGRGHIQSLFKNSDGTDVAIRYVDKKRIQSWLNVNRLQLPLHNLDSDSAYSISDNPQKVNGKYSLSTQSVEQPDTDAYSTPLIDLYYKGDGEADTVETDSDVGGADSFFDSPEMNLSGLMELGQKERVATEPQRRISADMSESERYEILKNRKLVNIPTVYNIPQKVIQAIKNNPIFQAVSSWRDIGNYFGKEKRTLIQKIASEFGVFKDYKNTDIGVSFEFSNNNFRESYSKQGKNYESFAKMFSVFDQVVENAVGIEMHNRNDKGYKPDITLNNVYVLVSAFEDGDLIYPVKLEIKEFSDKPNTLYVAIALEAIKKTEVSKQGTTVNSVAQNSRSVTISIQDIFKNVNIKDINFLKYVPNQFLNEEQIATKNKALDTDGIQLNSNNKQDQDRYETSDTEELFPQSFFDSPEMNLSGLMELGQKERVATEPQRRISDSDTADEASQLPYTVQNDPLPFVTAEEYVTEEYQEKTASNRAFTDDPTKYEGKERYIVERAIASGVLNDTEASHRLVDLAAKLYARTGVEFEFVNNERLKESGFSVGNRFVNGVYTGKTVLINAESRKAWQSVIGHEITHVLEGSKHYGSLQRAVIGYAKQIGTYDAKLQEVTDTYSAVENANITEELTAELVGEYLFSDEGFVNSLAVNQPNVAQRILNEIRCVISLIKANTPEARKLLIAQHRLERALDSKLKNNSGEVRYSLTQKDVRDLDINWDPNNFSTLKEQLIAHLDEVNSMQPVAKVNYSNRDKRPYYKVLEETLKKSFGNKIDVQGLGSILFDEGAISSIKNYIETDAERAAALATPYVIKKGKIISGHKSHKNEGNPTLTFAAPAILNGEKGNVVVSVMFGKGRVHSLRVLSPEGEAFELLKTKDTESTTEKFSYTAARENESTEDLHINSVSDDIITFSNGNVKGKYSLSPQNYTSTENQGTPLIDLYYKGDGEADMVEVDADVSGADSFFNSPEMNLSGLMELGQKERVATEPQRRISTEPKENRKGLRSRIADTGDLLYRKLVDSGKAISDIAKTVKDKYLYAYYNEARSSHNIATHMMSKAATDVNGNATGKSLKDIFAPIKSRGKQYYTDFQDYLFHKHNVSRMSYRNERAIQEAAEAVRDFRIRHPEISMLDDATLRNVAFNPNDALSDIAAEYVELLNNRDTLSGRQNKSVFGADENGELITAERSEQAVQDLLDENPEFEALEQEVYGYIDNLMKYRVDSGLITQEDADYLKSVYPHYVPTYRVTEYTGSHRQLNRADTSTAIGRATGGTSTLMELEQALSRLTEKVVREGTKNRFGMRLFRYANMPETKRYITNIAEAGADFNPSGYIDEEAGIEELNTANVFSVYNKGKKWELEVNDSLFEAVSALTPKPNSSNLGLRGLAAVNNVYKRLITGYNPAFWIRNGVKDIQDAGINSKDLSEFAKAYPTAISEIVNGGEYWKRYQALGGLHNSNYDYSTGMIDENTGLIKKGLDKVEAVSSFIEQLPRLTEFIATVNKNGGLENASTDVLAEAMYNAAEITTNFGRSGQWSKALNTYAVPFWNPSIQGFDKIIRNLSETKGYKDWFRLITKTAILGLAPFALNALLYSDDEDWEAVREEDKANYFLFKYDDGKWIKIPRGRFYSALSYTADEIVDASKGEGFDLKGVGSHAVNQIGPANPLTNNFFMPLVQTKLFDDENPGETWYGSDIESQSLQSLPVSERYDARTDEVSKWLGRTLKLSPKKINYLLNQYGGVLADVVLPMMTPAAENNILSANFTLNTLPSNIYTDRYYEAKKDAEYSANGTDATPTDELMSRYWSKQDTLLKEINKEIRRIEADGSVSDKEKKEMLEAQYALRNELYKKALDGQSAFRKEGDGFYGEADSISDTSDRLDFAYTMAAEAVNPELSSKGSAKTTYDKLADAGLSDSVCTSLTRAIVSLEPLGDKTSVSQAQKWDAVAQAGYPEETTLEALKALATEEAQSKRLDLCYDNNVPLKAFTALKLNMSEYDTNGNGSYSAAEYQKAIDGLFPTSYGFVLPGGDNEISLTVQQKAALWQIATGSSSVKNNPYGDYASGIAQAFNDGKASESGTQPKYNLPERKFNLPKREYNFPTRQ